MKLSLKSIFGLFTLAACAPLAIAQGAAQGQAQTPPPAQQDQQGQAQQGPAMHRWGPIQGQTGRGGQMEPDGRMGQGWQRGGRAQMGPRANIMRQRMRRRMRRRMYRRNVIRRRMAMRGGPLMAQRMGPGGMGPGMSGRGMGGPGMMMGGRGGDMQLNRVINDPNIREKIGITPEQVAKINQQQTDFQKLGIQTRATLETKHLELGQLMSADKPDRAAIDKKLSEISTAQLAQEQANVHHMLDMKSALTPEQQSKLKDLMQQARQPGPGGPGAPGRGGRGGPQGGPGRGGRGSRPQPPPPPDGGSSGGTATTN